MIPCKNEKGLLKVSAQVSLTLALSYVPKQKKHKCNPVTLNIDKENLNNTEFQQPLFSNEPSEQPGQKEEKNYLEVKFHSYAPNCPQTRTSVT